MGICVVITGFNDEGTILESTESVLSQARYPEQIGFSHGPSWDSTEEFASFYREEFDFVHWDSKINASECGLMHLRLGALSEVETSHVLFVRANSYLYRDALGRAEEAVRNHDLVTVPVQFMAPDGSQWTWDNPGSTNPDELIRHGPLPPSGVIWSVSLLKDVFTKLQTLKLGPFSTLGWLQVLRAADPDVGSLEEPLVETWDFREGDHCWSRSVFDSLHRVLDRPDGASGFSDQVHSVIGSTEHPSDEGFWPDESPAKNPDGSTGNEPPDWLTERYPMVE